MDPTANTLTFRVKSKDGPAERTVQLAKDVPVTLDDGLAKKKTDAPAKGQLSDLAEGVNATIQLSVDRKTARGVTIHGPTLNAALMTRDELLAALAPASLSVLDGMLQDMSQRDLAHDLGVSPSAVSQRIRRDGLAVLAEADRRLGAVR